MAVEGEFPKIAGDYLFASEVNRISSAGRFIEVGSTATVTHGVGVRGVAGSVVVGAGSLSNPSHITLNARIDEETGNNITIGVSGQSANINPTDHPELRIGSGIPKPMHLRMDLITGSPFGGTINFNAYTDGENQSHINSRFSGREMNALSTDEEFVIFFNGEGNVAGSITILSYSIQSFRGTV